ncbi:hypothetical protein Tco_1096045, partial [Tanacetum coccineum]
DVMISDGIEKPDGSDTKMLVKKAKKENEAENGTKNEPIKRAEREEEVEAPSPKPVGYYPKPGSLGIGRKDKTSPRKGDEIRPMKEQKLQK